jgi:hypothetical protein
MVGRMIPHPPLRDGAWRTKRPTQRCATHRSACMAQPIRQGLVFGFAAFGSCGARTSVRSIQLASKNPGQCTPSSNRTVMVGRMIPHPPLGACNGRADDPSSATRRRRLEDQAPYPIACAKHRSARMAQPTRQGLIFALLSLARAERGLQSAAFPSGGQECPRSLHLQAGVESSWLRAERLQALNKKLSTHSTPSPNRTVMVGRMIPHPPLRDGAWRTKRPTQSRASITSPMKSELFSFR